MNASDDMHEILPSIISIAKEYLDVKRISVMLIEDNALRIYAHAGFDIAPDNINIPVGKGISGHVAESGTEVVVNRAEMVRVDMGYEASSFLSLPLRSGEKIIGVLNLTDKSDDFFSENDISIAKYIASQCALAVERFELYSEKQRTENLKVIGMLRSSIAHDIKNLIGIVQAYLDLLQMETFENPDLMNYIDSIYAEIKRIHGLTVDMLEFSRQRIEVRPRRFKMNALFAEMERHNRIMVRDTDISISFRVDPELEIVADQEKLFRVLFNLVNNAIDALGDHGSIIVRARKAGDFVVFAIFDTGPGIPQENLKKIFDPFFTKGKLKGTGLGLAIVKEIIKAHSGTIRARSQEGKYTLFQIKVPLHG